jgi:hypothetical protein
VVRGCNLRYFELLELGQAASIVEEGEDGLELAPSQANALEPRYVVELRLALSDGEAFLGATHHVVKVDVFEVLAAT